MGDKGLHVLVRGAANFDMPEILAVEKAGSAFPWTEKDFRSVLADHAQCLVAERDGEVLGFLVYEHVKRGMAVLDLAVRPDSRRRGVARQLMTRVVGKTDCARRPVVTLDVCEDNLPTHLFLRSMGFLAVKVDRAAYTKSKLDAYTFEYDLTRATIGAGR